MTLVSVLLPLLAACDRAPEPCTPDVMAWEDGDGDGFGGLALGKVCRLGAGQVDVPQDCDDGDPERRPDATETCDGVDNDCDGRVDEDSDLRQFWFDSDGDGFGGLWQSKFACGAPSVEWVRNSSDCDDQRADVNPDALEVCGRVDEDCDGYVDESDDSVDPASFSVFFADKDGDGLGDANDVVERCRLITGYVINADDCDDTDPLITQRSWWADGDGDGYGDPADEVKACDLAPPGRVANDDDCDDGDSDLTYASDWYEDLDGDGFGHGTSQGFACEPPDAYAVRQSGDCNDAAAGIAPDAVEVCEDGTDQDCSGTDASCSPLGSFRVSDGEPWYNDPPVYSCVEVCAQLFGGAESEYHCSTSNLVVDELAYLSGYSDTTYCTVGAPEDFKKEQTADPGFLCGAFGCAYSAYVDYNCSSSRNWCWQR